MFRIAAGYQGPGTHLPPREPQTLPGAPRLLRLASRGRCVSWSRGCTAGARESPSAMAYGSASHHAWFEDRSLAASDPARPGPVLLLGDQQGAYTLPGALHSPWPPIPSRPSAPGQDLPVAQNPPSFPLQSCSASATHRERRRSPTKQKSACDSSGWILPVPTFTSRSFLRRRCPMFDVSPAVRVKVTAIEKHIRLSATKMTFPSSNLSTLQGPGRTQDKMTELEYSAQEMQAQSGSPP